MFDSYVKEFSNNQSPELPEVLVKLYQESKTLDSLIDSATRGSSLKISQLRAALNGVLSTVQEAQLQLKSLRTNDDSKELVPNGINNVLTRILKVTTDLANATIHAAKEDRLSQRELVEAYRDSYPLDKLTQALQDHVMAVRARRASDRTGSRTSAADKQIAHLAKSYTKFYAKLPNSLRGLPFTAFQIPVAPLFADIGAQIDPSKLERAGFDVTRVGDGYIVLEQQYLIAFDHKALGIDSGVRKVKGGYRIVKLSGPKRELAKEEANDKLIELIETVNARSHVRYALASTKFVPNPKNPSMWLAWIVTEKQRTAMMQMLRTIEVDWGLPFSLNEDE